MALREPKWQKSAWLTCSQAHWVSEPVSLFLSASLTHKHIKSRLLRSPGTTINETLFVTLSFVAEIAHTLHTHTHVGTHGQSYVVEGLNFKGASKRGEEVGLQLIVIPSFSLCSLSCLMKNVHFMGFYSIRLFELRRSYLISLVCLYLCGKTLDILIRISI